ncbi:actin interacting protein-like protein [Strigomonas culicis]|uniref:Actin interacting protein-like protein n=3 Tax=Strigomonas culicis TaxID=28005 RepID=S9U9H3_9TRYP|nr:actin interacting protein-like protein [Strigomonas culicis]EPY25901.1 actin interacting protein-like protein [Strigomonas culicis]|eukprot:EPY25568.1 actin interacting protein-like protein [Strigomonas culicis]
MSGLSAMRQRALHYAARSSAYAKVTDQHLEALRTMLQQPSRDGRKGRLLTDQADTEPFNHDWMKQVEGATPAVLLPTCAEQIADVLRYCQTERLAVVPQGGNTGLVFGSEPVHDELVLSTQLMNAAPVVSRDRMTVEAEAGVVLQQCQEACEKEGLLYPLTMGSRGSAQMGGTVSTNAGGIHFARYGSMHANVLGLEVVTPTGDILNLMSTLRKDNAGYDLKHLFIGSEGTLGVVTRVAVKLSPYPRSKQLCMLWMPDFASVLELYQLAQTHLAEGLSAFEVMDGESLLPSPVAVQPFQRSDNNEAYRTGRNYHAAYFCVMVETNGSNEDHDFEKLGAFIEQMQEKMGDRIPAGFEPVLSQSQTQYQQLWQLREDTPVFLAADGLIYKYDVSFPLDKFYIVVEYVREILYRQLGLNPEEVYVVGYGHFGDGNVHLNVVDRTRSHREALDKALYPTVYKFCAAHGGSISAEHGVGMQKRDYLSFSRSTATIDLMRQLKTTMDPNHILNPYKVLPLVHNNTA